MRFIPGLLVGYCIRGKQRLLIGTLTAIAIIVFIVVPAIALSLLALDVRRERLSRPPQTLVPVVVGLNYETAQIRLREANLKVRVLANRHDLSLESGIVITQRRKPASLRPHGCSVCPVMQLLSLQKHSCNEPTSRRRLETSGE